MTISPDMTTIAPPIATSVATASGFQQLSLEGRDAQHFNKLASVLLVAAAVVFVAARLWHLAAYGFFGDEVFTLWTAQQDWRGLSASIVGDVAHPPLFYALLKVWIGIGGQSPFWLKLLPALLSIASVVPFLLLCRELKLERPAIALALWLMAVNGFLINHAQELRMYSLVLLLTICSLWLFAKLLNRVVGTARNQVALCAVNLLLVFTHYYGWVVVALELVFLLIWRRERARSFAIAVGFVAFCFSPWVYVVAQAARDNPSRVNFAWNRPPAMSELAGFYANLNGVLSYRWRGFGTALVMLAFLLPVIGWCWRVLRRGRERESTATAFWWLALFSFAPAVAAFVASHLLPQSVWAFRYLVIEAPTYLLMVATAAYKLKPNRVRTVAVVLILCWSSLSGLAELVDRDKIAWEPLVQRMVQAAAEQTNIGIPNVRRSIVAVRPSPVTVYVTDANVGNTIQFYLDQAGEMRFQAVFVDSLDRLDGDHYWVALIRYKHETGPLPQSAFSNRGYQVGDAIESVAAGHRAILFPVWKRE